MSTAPGPGGNRDPAIAGHVAATDALDWRAIAAGAGASLAIGFSASFLMRPLFGGNVALGYGTLAAINLLVSILADAVGGATAGALARRRGAVHGALAMVLAAACGFVVTLVMLGRQGHVASVGAAFWLQWLAYAVLGLVVGTVAGLVAAKVAAAKSTQ